METEREQDAAAHVRAGQEALADGQWRRARAEFEQALAEHESPEALEGLGMATSRMEEAPTALEAREIAYWLYDEAGTWAGAARMATWLALGHSARDPNDEQAQTWLKRAHTQLSAHGPVAETGWLALCEGKIALIRGDVQTARRLGAEAGSVGRRLNLIELERDGLELSRSGWDADGLSHPPRARALRPMLAVIGLFLAALLIAGGLILAGAMGHG
jgi:tetratricopeptide (TPR) repeat protein